MARETEQKVIGVDTAGADTPIGLVHEACLEAATSLRAKVRCYVTEPFFQNLEQSSLQSSCIDYVVCKDVISMYDDPLSAVRKKKESTLMRAIQDEKEGSVHAVLSLAHTGAVVLGGALFLKRFSNLKHPALLAEVPSLHDSVLVLDVGAFVEASVQDMVSYAYLGSSFFRTKHELLAKLQQDAVRSAGDARLRFFDAPMAEAHWEGEKPQDCESPRAVPCCSFASNSQDNKAPRVGVLNIGREPGRGTQDLRLVKELLEKSTSFSFVGNLEPKDVFLGKTDVLITNGFTGNIFLKTAEGVGELIRGSGPSFLSSRRPGGALLAGIHGLLYKCHGKSSKERILRALFQADEDIHSGLLDAFSKEYERQML